MQSVYCFRNKHYVRLYNILNLENMIQRIQTLFLSLAAIAAALVFFFPIADFFSDNYSLRLSIFGVEKFTEYSDGVEVSTLPLIICAALMVIVPFFTVFLFKKRIVQIRLSRLSIFLNFIFLFLLFFIYVPEIQEATGASAEYLSHPSIYFPLASILLLILATRYISRDEKLIRAADRIR